MLGKVFHRDTEDIAGSSEDNRHIGAQIAAIHRSQAVIEFELDGTIVNANANFCDLMGYNESELVGQHHGLFVEPSERQSLEYQRFWSDLADGIFASAIFRRITSSGRPVWIRATYNPLLDENGKPYRVVKFATDITEDRIEVADRNSQIEAFHRSQAVIEFDLNGRILKANNNFVQLMGYRLDEIVGQHHKMFVDPGFRESPEYQNFWARLSNGEFISGQFQRFTASGQPVWLQASYNPVFDLDGKPVKVVKIASDITADKQLVQDFEQVVGESSQTIRSMASHGEEVVARAVTSIQAIEDSTNEMTQITTVIEEIAFQTNLLALNAAVEAARAGDNGRSFAVVAQEVRSLASRSSTAAKDIASLIGVNVDRVAVGSSLSGTLTDIVRGVADLSQLIGGVADGDTQVTDALVALAEMKRRLEASG